MTRYAQPENQNANMSPFYVHRMVRQFRHGQFAAAEATLNQYIESDGGWLLHRKRSLLGRPLTTDYWSRAVRAVLKVNVDRHLSQTSDTQRANGYRAASNFAQLLFRQRPFGRSLPLNETELGAQFRMRLEQAAAYAEMQTQVTAEWPALDIGREPITPWGNAVTS